MATTEEVVVATGRLAAAGLDTRPEGATTCCHALQDEVWVTAPGGEPWEVYTVEGDARPDLEGRTAIEESAVAGDGTCCADPTADRAAARAATSAAGACC